MKNKSPFAAILLAVTFAASSPTAQADVFVTSWIHGTVAQYSNDGQLINPALLSGLSFPSGIAISGNNLYVASAGKQRIGHYTITGQTINDALITGLSQPFGVAVSGSELYVADYGEPGKIRKYTTSGNAINTSFITGLYHPLGVAASGGEVYVSHSAAVARYTTAGSAISQNMFFNSVGSNPPDLKVDGSDLYVVNNTLGKIGKFTTSGSIVNSSFITGLSNPYALALADSRFYVLNSGSVSVFDSSGASVGSFAADGLYGIAVTSAVPEPASLVLLALGAASLVARRK